MPQLAGPIIVGLKIIGVAANIAVPVANAIVQIGLTIAITAATEALTRPPTPEAGKTTIKQELPARRYGFGRFRASGPFMLRETNVTVLGRVVALPEGPATHFGRHWLNDDEVTLISGVVQSFPDGRYPTPKTVFDHRLGAETETAYSQAITYFPGLWTSHHRGDGIPSFWLYCKNGDRDKFSRDFPNGEPDPSVEEFVGAYDWRDEAQDRDDPATWAHTRNVVVGLANALWRRFGVDWDAEIAPNLASLTAEADRCDDAIALAAGGTEPRYEAGFFWMATNEPAPVIETFLSAMDGWMGRDRRGAWVIRCGHAISATYAFGDAEILEYEFVPGPAPDQAINCLKVSFVDPAHAYSQVETDPWRDETDILARGEERSEEFSPQAVQANGQVRRLSKRRLSKLLAGSGTIRTPLSARRALGARYIEINCSELDDLNGTVVEIVETSIELETASIVWSFIVADPNVNTWNPDTEEGEGPVSADRPTPEALDPADIDTITPFFEDNGTGGSGVRLTIDATGPDRDDLIWYARWRVSGDIAWVEAPFTDLDPGPTAELKTGFVTANATLDVQVAYRTGSGSLSEWGPATPTTVNTTLDTVPPDPPTLLVDLGGDVGAAHIQWRNPSSTNFDHWRVYRGTTTVFGSATAIGSDTPGAPGATVNFDNTVAAGVWRYWVLAKNSSGTPSSPVGPLTVTVT